jgi:glycosyltransferase involved in cell wall biosynthesis
MRILIVTTQWPFVWGGAEFHAQGLAEALGAAGHQVDIVRIPGGSGSPEHMDACARFCLGLDLSSISPTKVDRVIGLKFPAYLVPHNDKIHWILHQQRTLYDLWDQLPARIKEDPSWIRIREQVHRWDSQYIPKARAVFANSVNVASRLKRYNGIQAVPLYHPPPSEDRFYCESAEDFFLAPSRLVPHKRPELILEALSKTKQPINVSFMGGAVGMEYESELKKLSRRYKVDERCRWLGWVSEEDKIKLYARCIGVLYPPYDEDLGYGALEAMLASKPLITCVDSGGPLEFVEHEKSALICNPTPEDLAEAMDMLRRDRALAKDLGETARQRYSELNLSWSNVVETLLR